ncbi:MAG: glycosyltransferase family 2 protein [Bacilli bacterium]|nr:glycosyltransferase family 2 protein [Bacilli bacterium]
MQLTIITPYYDTLKYIKFLSKILNTQLTDEVEWLIIDDGCNEKELDELPARVIHLEKNSGNASTPRNIGLDNAKGKYITFVDSDDLVSLDYVSKILNKIKTSDFDYCFFSWQSINGKRIIKDQPEKWNTSVWNCIYKKELIGDTRFNPKQNIGEDELFNKEVRKGKKENIEDILYFYNWGRPDSMSTNYLQGKIGYTKE